MKIEVIPARTVTFSLTLTDSELDALKKQMDNLSNRYTGMASLPSSGVDLIWTLLMDITVPH